MKIAVGILVIGLAGLAEAKEWPCTISLPALLDGCEGERCESAENKITKDVTLYEKPDQRSRIVARLKGGDSVQSIAHKTLVQQVGKFVVTPGYPERESSWAIQGLKKYGVEMGDVIIGVQYGGEGVYRHCIGDTLFYIEGNSYGLEESKARGDQLKTEAWSFVKSKHGNGWAPGSDWYRSLAD
jgi:hypothetical protein